MKIWHRFLAWRLTCKLRRERHELAKLVRRSAYEIAAWHQDILELEEKMHRHLNKAMKPSLPAVHEDTEPENDKIVSILALPRPSNVIPLHREPAFSSFPNHA